MSDSVSLKIGGQVIENFLSYSIEADIYTADDAFTVEAANPEIRIDPGKLCELYINGQKELVGIIDRIDDGYSRSGSSIRIDGRDLCGLLTDSYCEEFITLEDMTCKELAERLLKNVPYIKRNMISYQESIRGKSGDSDSFVEGQDTAQNFTQIEPGQTIFDVLKTYAGSRGMMFFHVPDGRQGKFVFGKPRNGGKPLYYLYTRKSDPGENNVLEGDRVRDISRRYSKISVIGQQQGTDDYGSDDINTEGTVTDATFPFYKPYIATDNNDSQSPKLRAQMMMERMKFDGFQLTYRVAGHSQNGRNWRINEMCRVIDEHFGIDDNYLIYGRTFERSDQGTFTTLKLSFPGVVQ